MTENKNKNYLEPGKFFSEMIDCLIRGEMSNELGEMFTLVASRYTNHREFVRYIHLKDDLTALGVVACCESFSKFRPLKGQDQWDGVTKVDYHHTTCNNPHAFFTTCIRNKWLQFLKKEYNCRNAVNGLRVKNGLDPDYGYSEMMKDKEEKAKKDAESVTEEKSNGIVW